MRVVALVALVACGGTKDEPEVDAPVDSTSCTPTADTCVGDTICIANACAPAYPGNYRVTAFVIHVPLGFTHDPDGKPDLQPHVAIGNPSPLQDVTPIPVSKDTFDLTLPGPFDVTLMTNATSLMVGVDDVDPQLASPQIILDCIDTPASAQMLRAGGDSCANGPATISFKIAPKVP